MSRMSDEFDRLDAMARSLGFRDAVEYLEVQAQYQFMRALEALETQELEAATPAAKE